MALVLAAFAVLLIIASVPIVLVHVAPLVDYPQHLARVYILGYFEKSPILRQYYSPDWGFQPNLAIESVVLPLTNLLDINLAGKLFLILLLFALSSGCLALHRVVHHKWSLWPLLVFFVLYNRVFLGGIVNYLFTLGLAFWAFAAWIYFRNSSLGVRLIVSVPAALILLLGHLVAFGTYALMVAGYEITRHLEGGRKWYIWSRSDLVAAGTQFMIALIVLFSLSRTAGALGEFRYAFMQKFDAPFNLLYNYNLLFDATTFLALIGLLGAGLATGKVVISKSLLLSIGLVALAFLAMPYEMAGSLGADRRMTVAIALLMVAATDWRAERIHSASILLAALAVVFIVRMAIIDENWLKSDGIYQQYLVAFDQLPRGARLGVVIAHNSTQTITNPPINAIGQYAIIRRDAFVSNTFTQPGAQPLSFTPQYSALAKQLPIAVYEITALRRLANPRTSAKIDPYSCHHLTGYDYLLVGREPDFPVKPPSWLTPIASGQSFHLFKVGTCRLARA